MASGGPPPGGMPGQGGPGGPPPGSRQPTPQEIQQIQQQIAQEAAKRGMTPQQYVAQIRAQQMQAQMRAQQAQQQQGGGQGPPQQPQQPPPQGQQGGHQQPVQPGPPKPEAIAVANFLKGQDLKQRTCLFQEKRKDMFKVKRAIRAIQSPAYQKARTKNPILPPVNSEERESAENVFKQLPLSLLALRVSKVDPHEGHNHGKKGKRVKGLWTVKIEQQQDADDMSHYMWMYEGSQWKQKAYAAGALALVITVVMFPLWPYTMRLGVWYLSMGCLGLLGLFFAMAIVRLLLFCATVFTVPPGLWLYPNLFEDVGFFDSFKPFWAWHETAADVKAKKKAKKSAKAAKAKTNGMTASSEKTIESEPATTTSSAEPATGAQLTQRRGMPASVEEAEDE